MIKAKIIYDVDDDGVERAVELDGNQLSFVLGYCKDLNGLMFYLEGLKTVKRTIGGEN